MNLLAKGQALLLRLLPRDASPAGLVTYVRKVGGAEIDLSGNCWVGETTFTREPSDHGPAVSFDTRDYLVPVSLLVGPPARGDRIHEDVGETTPKVWEVISDNNFDCWRYSDRAQTIYRISTKRASS